MLRISFIGCQDIGINSFIKSALNIELDSFGQSLKIRLNDIDYFVSLYKIMINDINYKSGNERSAIFENSDCFIFCFDFSKLKSFEKLILWLEESFLYADECYSKIILGLKSDLKNGTISNK